MGSLFTSDKVRTEITPLPRLRKRMFKSESDSCDLNEDSGNCKRKGDLEDLLISDMTLKELQERYKKKKKLQESASSGEQNIRTGSFGDMKQDDANVRTKEEESNLEIPLSAWKRKVSKKAKQNISRKKVWPSSVPEISLTDQIPSGSGDHLSSVYDKHDPPNSETGNTKSEHSDFLAAACCVANGSTLGSLRTNDTCQVLREEVNKCVTGGGIEDMVSGASVSVNNGGSFERLKPCHMNFSPSGATISDSLPISVSGLTKVNHVANRTRGNNLEEKMPASPDMVDSHKGYILQPQISCQMNCDIASESPNLVNPDTLQPKELNGGDTEGEIDNGGDITTFRGNVFDNIESLHMSSMDPIPYFSSYNDARSVLKDSPLAEDVSVCTTDGPIYASVYEGLECLSNVSPIPSNGFTAIELLDSPRETRIHCTPRRLLSTRKEKLRKAMDIQGHCDYMESSRSDFEEAKISDSQVSEKRRKNIDLSPQAIPKGILKAVHFSVGTPPDGTENSSIPSRAQKAVAFSQRQMQDIESLAMKLMKELKSMKGIVEESLHSKECSSTPAYTADETRSAVLNAAEVEETTKKWLSMMARDCNRFCKIMRSTGKASAASPVSTERKKIIFADEAGGSLCHVKILENTQASALVPESESAN